MLGQPSGKVCAAPFLLIGSGLASGPETEQGLKRGHCLRRLIKIYVKLIAAHAVMLIKEPVPGHWIRHS